MRLALALLLWGLSAHAFAQAQMPDRDRTELVSCLRLAIVSHDRPSLPETANGGHVRVEAKFIAPELPPTVTILESSGDAELDAAVARYLSNYRLPCMKPGDAPVQVGQNFVFDSHDSTTFGTALHASATQDEMLVGCATRVDKSREPEYPDHEVLGSVMVEATFRGPDAEPDVTLLAAAPSQQLNDAARAFVRGYRMPCVGNREVKAWQLFHFRGASHSLNTTGSAWLKLTRGGRNPPAEFDLDAMGCPLRVVLRYWEPVRRNRATVLVSGVQPSQKAFIDWLASLRLDSAVAENLLLGDDVNIRVGCGKIGP
jgi:hypothetical protein